MKTLHQLQSRGIDNGNLSCCGLTTEEHHGCISHWCALSSTSPNQQHITSSSKCSATTQQQLQSGPSVDTRPLRSSWKWTSRHARKARCTNSNQQPGTNLSYQEKATITKALMIPSQEKGADRLLSRPEQVIMTRLRTEHNRWYAHMHKKLQMVLSADCPFGEEDWQTTEHILQNCKGHDQERYTAWPTETTLLSENTWWRTTEFILVTGLTV